MVRTVRPAGFVAAFMIYLLVMLSGCQQDRATTSAPEVEPAAPAAPGGAPTKNAAPAAPATTPMKDAASAAEPRTEPAAGVELPEAGPPVDLTLKFTPAEVMTCKATTEMYKSVEWMGTPGAMPASFKDGRSGNRVEITFAQRVRTVEADGGAVLDITLRALKYVGEIQTKVVLDFDSARDRDPNHPLAGLIGKSYGVRMSPRGQMIATVDVEPLRQAIRGDPAAAAVARKLLSDEEIRDRHEIPPLSARPAGPVRPGQTWSDIKTFSFGMMGVKSFERVYTFKGVEPGPERLAVVEMKAIPSAAGAVEAHKEDNAGLFSRMFDNTANYEGRLTLELDRGRLREYVDEMRTEWVIADPATMQDGKQTGGRPAAFKMGASRRYRWEQLP
jgi:hypothetical protein